MKWADDIRSELSRIESRYGPVASTHEGYGVLAEEVDELFDAIKANDLEAVKREALQVATVAVRLYLASAESGFCERSTK